MKLKASFLGMTILAAGCGMPEESTLKQGKLPSLPYSYHTATAEVVNAATLFGFPGPNGEMTHQTTATVQIPLACGQKVHSFVMHQDVENRQVNINYQAVLSTDNTAGVCETDPKPYETYIMVDGVYSKEDFVLLNVSTVADSTDLKPGETSLYAAVQAEVVSAGKICPAPTEPGQISCKALGSRIEVKLSSFGCIDRMALTNWRVSQDEQNGRVLIHLAAFGVNHIDNRRARCSEEGTKRSISITTLNDVNSAEDVKVELLR